jgi:glycyl-tRNA synthetase
MAQIGKAFRNEITPGNFTFRSREFEQMELEFFVEANEKEAEKWFTNWKKERMRWYVSFGMSEKKLRFRKHADTELAHYAKAAEDIEYEAPFGWSEFEGIHNRGDWDLSSHKLNYKDEETGKEFTPWVIETSGGVDRSALFFLIDAYHEEEKRVVFKLHPKLAPYKAAVFPLLANKPELVNKAKEIYKNLRENFVTVYDGRGNIGKRYYSQDEIGTPFCVTVDFQTLKDNTVTVRDRDTMKQERIKIDNLIPYISEKIKK